MAKIKYFLATSLNKIKNTEREEIELPQGIISKHLTDQKSYLLNMEIDRENNKNKYDLLIKVLITLKLLVEINKNKCKIVEQIKSYEEEKVEKQK